ncbi:type IV secretion system protein VirB4 [Microbacterium oxydans]|uniref:ATP-binding protein n=2 Tax=Microbacterium oxydans TaxID=82380 RepID=UPI001143E56B|nr:ATP-binding protein [Microbacterium oxydans]KAB1888803.1 type IV secretion system protein VirB4 [Microbacterium oxydans]GED40619.1 ATP/GTP-binding protein [Microbacterium oxydans]
MHHPAIALTKNLMWTRSGVVWAMWRLQPAKIGGRQVIYPYASFKEQLAVKGFHQAFYQQLRGEALLLGLTAEIDPVEIVQRMIDGIDLERATEWKEEAELTLDALEQIPLGTRAFWLAVPLAAEGIWDLAQLSLFAAEAKGRNTFALPRRLPPSPMVDRALEAARQIEKRIPAAFNPTPSSPAEMVWVNLHSQQRGLAADTVPTPPTPAGSKRDLLGERERSEFTLPAAIPGCTFDEGGQSDVARWKRRVPFKRRYLKVQSDAGFEPSYQVLQRLAGAPKGGWESPGVEWMSFVDQLPIDVDWIQRLTIKSARDVRHRNKKAEQTLGDQYDQQQTANSLTGGRADLDESLENLGAYIAELNNSEREVEVEAAIFFVSGGPSPEVALAKAQIVADAYAGTDFTITHDLGEQEEFWWAGIPGAPTTRIIREVSHITSGRMFASGVPLVGFELGDPKGARIGVNISGGRPTPVLSDPDGAIVHNMSSSFGVTGELGSGKSVLMKCDMGDTLDMLGRVIAFDRTEKREYAHFARSLEPDRTAVVDLMRPEWSVDPLRMFGPRRGARMVQSLFTTMLGIAPRDERGLMLSRILEKEYLAAQNITSLPALAAHIEQFNSPETKELSNSIRLVSTKDLGEVLFNGGLPAMDVDARAIVFLTAGLTVPDQSELFNKHLFEEMDLEKIVGRALNAMLIGVSRSICFQDDDDLATAYIDECYAVTSSPEGARDVKIWVKDGRKHRARVGLGSQEDTDFGSARGLLRIRYNMRQTDESVAFQNVKWMTGMKEDEDVNLGLVREVTELSPVGADSMVLPGREGESFMRDQQGRIGKWQKSLPERPHRRAAVLSTPPARKVA